jgi:hypothetical protein
VKVRDEKFGSVVFETLKEKVYVSNKTGSDILKLLREGKNEVEIVSELTKNYNCDPSAIETDVKEYITCLKQNNILY